MSQIKKLPPPKKWTKAGKDWIAKLGATQTAQAIGVTTSTLSQWHHGHQRPTADRVDQIITLAMQEGVCLTPADLGRPDLAKKAGQG
jgi:transcriptional regulator with XRE-family HTH domain